MALELLHGGHDDEHGQAPAHGKRKVDKQHRDSMVIILVGVVGVILTWLIYRSNKAKEAAGGGPITSASLGSGSGTVLSPAGSANVGAGGADNGLASYLNAQFQDMTDYQKHLYDSLSDSQARLGEDFTLQLQDQQNTNQSALAALLARLEAINTHNTDTNAPAPAWSAPIVSSPVFAQPWPSIAPSSPAMPSTSSSGQLFATPSSPPPDQGYGPIGSIFTKGGTQYRVDYDGYPTAVIGHF